MTHTLMFTFLSLPLSLSSHKVSLGGILDSVGFESCSFSELSDRKIQWGISPFYSFVRPKTNRLQFPLIKIVIFSEI